VKARIVVSASGGGCGRAAPAGQVAADQRPEQGGGGAEGHPGGELAAGMPRRRAAAGGGGVHAWPGPPAPGAAPSLAAGGGAPATAWQGATLLAPLSPCQDLVDAVKNSPAVRLATLVRRRWPTPPIMPPTTASAS
jgi:hypothetical protein